MLKAITHISIWVRDQDEALSFYRDKLGFEVKEDQILKEFGGYRWLILNPPDQPDLDVMLDRPSPPAVDQEVADQILDLVDKGAVSAGILSTDDLRATYLDLTSKGVDFTQGPTARPYGEDAAFRDPSGNQWRITQPPVS